MTERLRLFVAVEVPAAVRDALDLAVAPLQARWQDARWIDPAKWHLTLQFLGHLEADRLPTVSAAVSAAAAAVGNPFPLALSGTAGHFGGRVVWAALAPSPALSTLAAAVRAELAARALPADERPFRAHLTLARSAGRGRLARDLVVRDLPAWRGPAASWTVDSVTLMHSQLGRGGSTYTALRRSPLGAGPSGADSAPRQE